jgi:uncharacterized phage protein gp47/JayE
MAAPSWQDLRDIFGAEALARRPKSNLNPGTRYDMIASGAAAIGDLLVGYFDRRFRASYVDGAEGDDLTVLADDHYSITRIPAVKATGSVTFNRAAPGAGTYSIPTGAVLATGRDAAGNELRYVTTAPAAWGAGVGGDVTVAAQAENAGGAANVPDETIARILTAQTEQVTVTNALAIAGGSEAETDDALRQRIRAYAATIQRGTKEALEYGARQVPECRTATATEDSTGRVTVYVTDADGNSDPTLVSAVTAELENWRAVGSYVTVVGGALLSVDVQVTLTVRPGANAAQLASAVQAVVVARMSKLAIGETVYRTAISQAVHNVDRGILEADVLVRTGSDPYAAINIAPYPNQIPRAGAVTVV